MGQTRMRSKPVSLIALVMLSCALLLMCRVHSARTESATIVVPDDYPTVQQAINNSNEGDTIFVRAGTYLGSIVINRSLTLEGESRESTIIDAEYKELRVVLVTADNVKISGFTIQHVKDGGSAIVLDNYINMTFSNNIVTSNSEGIRILHSSGNIISNNIIQDCYYNTGLGFNWAYNNLVYGNIIENCNVGIGGNHWNNTFFENVIRDNIGGWAGWGISDDFYDCIFFHNNIIDNGNQVINSNPNPNTWDDGYPSGGNYWSDYTGADLQSGPNQDILGSDGIGDTPYVINANNIDYYPLVNPWVAPQPQPPTPVGGVWVPINKFELLAPWIGLASFLIISAVTVVYVRHKKKQQD